MCCSTTGHRRVNATLRLELNRLCPTACLEPVLDIQLFAYASANLIVTVRSTGLVTTGDQLRAVHSSWLTDLACC